MSEREHNLWSYWYRLKEFEFVYRRPIRGALIALFAALLLAYQFLLKARGDFPAGEMVHVERGLSLGEIARELETKRVLRAPGLFEFTIRLFGDSRDVMAGDYLFTKRIAMPRVAWRLLHGTFNLTPVAVTVPEGTTRKAMAELYAKRIPSFDGNAFLAATERKEGYLFPDTYFFFPNATSGQVVAEMERNFNAKLGTLEDDIEKTGHSVRGIIIMASILEGEAHRSEDRKIIAGILWKRIKLGMPLQVDAPFLYEIGKNTYELTTNDLAADSPYNTYTRRGLPAGPIGNPGLDAILATLYPTESPFLYYLSDRGGTIHYSATFEKHKQNKMLYID
ncbi:MAG: endolytic transglycosylase MltG [bacterium]|nr:endolytic transglycosylase MltG [bacterium]